MKRTINEYKVSNVELIIRDKNNKSNPNLMMRAHNKY